MRGCRCVGKIKWSKTTLLEPTVCTECDCELTSGRRRRGGRQNPPCSFAPRHPPLVCATRGDGGAYPRLLPWRQGFLRGIALGPGCSERAVTICAQRGRRLGPPFDSSIVGCKRISRQDRVKVISRSKCIGYLIFLCLGLYG